ncbi:putative membrane protein YjgA [Lacipirellula parvula]|uniref:Putative membrane protein YjgA n=1 Tax=Lacipirellula parvula TaxID=2650471 RepID=A0A5K7XGE3_9BACT|nr:putative membrane protein YjgA [Lacipirellula parvula]
MLAATIALGLTSRHYGEQLPPFIAAYAGDALWATMVYWLASIAWPHARTTTLAVIAYGVSFAVELSQLYHAPWIDSIRATRLGALALGHGFLWSDLVCYAVGVALASLIDLALLSLAKPRRRKENTEKMKDDRTNPEQF